MAKHVANIMIWNLRCVDSSHAVLEKVPWRLVICGDGGWGGVPRRGCINGRW